MLKDANAPVVLTQQSLARTLPTLPATKIVCLDGAVGATSVESTGNPARNVTGENLAYVIYTSGSTGQPKGAMIPHRAIVNHMRWMQETFPLDERDSVLQKTPFSFDASVWEFYAPLWVGGRLVVARPGGHLDTTYMVETIVKQGVTILQLVPSLLRMLLETPSFKTCRSLRRVFSGGEALTGDLVRRFCETLPAGLINLYGPTEVTIDSVFYSIPRDRLPGVVPIGRPVANTQAYVLDRHRQPVPIGVPGELYLGGAQVGHGYHNRPELTAERFIPDPFNDAEVARLYKTGDKVRHLPDGNIEYLGRMDHQVKIRGFRIELGEIETVLGQCPSVGGCVVVVREDVPGDKRLVAYLTAKAGEPPNVSELRSLLQTKLPEYMVPSAFVTLDRFPLTPNGKLDRKALPMPDLARPELEKAFVAPRTPIERVLADIWGEVLGLKQIGVHDNFFELGGHSLLATQVISRVRQAFEVDLPLRSLFESPTVEGMASSLLHLSTRRAELETRAELLLKVAELSESEVEAMLAQVQKRQ
jgi:amino acid adenylation domain-containing protein